MRRGGPPACLLMTFTFIFIHFIQFHHFHFHMLILRCGGVEGSPPCPSANDRLEAQHQSWAVASPHKTSTKVVLKKTCFRCIPDVLSASSNMERIKGLLYNNQDMRICFESLDLNRSLNIYTTQNSLWFVIFLICYSLESLILYFPWRWQPAAIQGVPKKM